MAKMARTPEPQYRRDVRAWDDTIEIVLAVGRTIERMRWCVERLRADMDVAAREPACQGVLDAVASTAREAVRAADDVKRDMGELPTWLRVTTCPVQLDRPSAWVRQPIDPE